MRSIAWPTRSKQTVVAGPRTNAGFLAALCRATGFRRGDFDTGFIDRHLAALGAAPRGLDRAAAATAAQALLAREQARLAATREPEAPARPGTPATASSLAARGCCKCR